MVKRETDIKDTEKKPEEVIEINNLSKGFADLKVLKNLSLKL